MRQRAAEISHTATKLNCCLSGNARNCPQTICAVCYAKMKLKLSAYEISAKQRSGSNSRIARSKIQVGEIMLSSNAAYSRSRANTTDLSIPSNLMISVSLALLSSRSKFFPLFASLFHSPSQLETQNVTLLLAFHPSDIIA